MRRRYWLVLHGLGACYGQAATHPVDDLADAAIDGAAPQDAAATDAQAQVDSATNDARADGSACDCERLPARPVCNEATRTCVECTAEDESACTAAKPLCGPSNACVACTASDLGACMGQTPLCLSASNQCVQCLGNTDCKAASAARCQGNACGACQVDADCVHVAGANVCLAGSCVACTKDKASACLANGTQYVCDPATHACDMNRRALSKTLCNVCMSPSDSACKSRPDCISDNECQAGQACVDVPAGAGTKVCLKVRDTSACPRPYIGVTLNPVPSADGPSVRVCTFAAATTCQAHADFRNKRCGTPKPGMPSEDQPNSGDDSKCGQPGMTDGYCAFSEGVNQYRCTVPCNGDDGDCPESGGVCNTAPAPYVPGPTHLAAQQ